MRTSSSICTIGIASNTGCHHVSRITLSLASLILICIGARVLIVIYRLLPLGEPEASEMLEDVFTSEGVIRVKGMFTSVKPAGKGGHEGICTLRDGSTTTVTGDVLLVAIGRSPNVKGFGLHEIGVTFNDKGGIKTNEKLQTGVKNVYAAGDCTGDRQL